MMHNLRFKLQTFSRPEYFFWGAVLCTAIWFFSDGEPSNISGTLNAQAAAVTSLAEGKPSPYQDVELLAKGAYVYDAVNKKELFAKDADTVRPLASITKVMTAITALSVAPETTDVTIGADAVRMEGDSGLTIGERWTLRDLLAFTLVESSNDGAVAVSSTIGEAFATSTDGTSGTYRAEFVIAMNTLAKSLGLASTVFLNESGLDIDETHAGAFSTPRDVALMLAYGLETFPSVFTSTRLSELALASEAGEHSAQNTNTATNKLPLLRASKTGYTDLAGGNLVIAFDAGFGHSIVVSVLGSTVDGRFEDVEKLVWATLKYINTN